MVSHASGIVAEAILEKFAAFGLAPDSLVLLDHEANAGKRVAYADGYLRLQDQNEFDMSGCSLLLMPEADSALESAALRQGCFLVSHAIEGDSPALFVGATETHPELDYSATSLRLVGAELSCLLPALLALDRMLPVVQLNATLLRSAEFRGKAGVDELAAQTISLLSARNTAPNVFPEQIAFNILPESTDAKLIADLGHFLGNISCSSMLQTLNVPIFHGFAAAVQLVFASDVSAEQSSNLLASLDMVTVQQESAGPISDCNQSFSCAISHLEQSPQQPSNLQFWMVTDPMRYGLANNYVNVADFLLKSFL